MVNIIENNIEHRYKVYDISTYVDANLDSLKYVCKLAYTYMNNYNISSSKTLSGRDGLINYNVFSLTAGSVHLNEIFKFIKASVYDFLDRDTKNLYMQAWINYDKASQVHDWHKHSENFLCQGHIGIDPKNTTTMFEKYSIKNKPGYIYIGPSNRFHKVIVNEPYSDHRITIAFDIISIERFVEMGMKITHQHCSFIPL